MLASFIIKEQCQLASMQRSLMRFRNGTISKMDAMMAPLMAEVLLWTIQSIVLKLPGTDQIPMIINWQSHGVLGH
jgi:hypothetical protein